MRFTAALLAALALAAACSSGPATLTLTATPASVPADGISTVDIVATVSPASAAAALTFTVEGIGDLAASNVAVVNGTATVKLMAPIEAQLEAGAPPTTVRASMASTAGLPIEATTTVTYSVPTSGNAQLTARTERDAVVVTSGEPHVLLINARRVTAATLTLRDDSDSVELPATVALEGEGVERSARIEVPAPAEAQIVNVTIAAEGVPAITVALRFINEGEPEFDVAGTFAQIQYGTVRISDFGLLANDPDCVRAESVALVTIEQNGTELAVSSETCTMTMPPVRIANPFGNPFVIQPRPGDGWIRAANEHDNGPVTFSLDEIAAGAVFDVPVEAFGPPMVVGAELANNETDDLPTDAADSADHDDDGEPGVTIKGDGGLVGDQHICYRNRMLSMTGTLESSSVISGEMEGAQESVIFGGSFGNPTVTGLPTPYFMQRVDGGGNGAPNIASRAGDPNTITCEDVAAYAAEMRIRFPVGALPSDLCPNNQ